MLPTPEQYALRPYDRPCGFGRSCGAAALVCHQVPKLLMCRGGAPYELHVTLCCQLPQGDEPVKLMTAA